MAKKASLAQLYSQPSTLKDALHGYPAGTWVALSQDQQRIVGSGRTAAQAERQATASGQKATVLLQVSAGAANGKSGNGNGAHHGNNTMPLNLPSFYRGIYKRVAKKLGCDPSYVSRVARGERASDMVSQALQSELSHAVALTGKSSSKLRRGYA